MIGVCILSILTERQTKIGHGMIPFVTLKMKSGVTKVSYKSFGFRVRRKTSALLTVKR